MPTHTSFRSRTSSTMVHFRFCNCDVFLRREMLLDDTMSKITSTCTTITIIFENRKIRADLPAAMGSARWDVSPKSVMFGRLDKRCSKVRQTTIQNFRNFNKRKSWLTVLPITALTADLMMRNGMFERYRSDIITGVCKAGN